MMERQERQHWTATQDEIALSARQIRKETTIRLECTLARLEKATEFLCGKKIVPQSVVNVGCRRGYHHLRLRSVIRHVEWQCLERHPDRCKVINCIVPDSFICQKNIAYRYRASGDPKPIHFVIIPPSTLHLPFRHKQAPHYEKESREQRQRQHPKFEVLKAA